jgi:hypothetical protein
MQEFSSVTASSYDADSLAPLLSEKSAEGWGVISIVSAGTNIVAYLSRDVSSAGDDTGEIDTPVFGGGETDLSSAEAAIVQDEITEAELDAAIDAEVASDVQALEAIEANESTDDVPSDQTPSAAPAMVGGADSIPQSEEISVGTRADAVDEPAGWGAAPEETAPETSVEDLAAQVSEPEPVEPEPVVPEPVVEPVVAEPVAEAAPAVESTVPAGWYADPSGRYELRYWDGTAWTEHVSRAGQQFTDPPVA